MATPTTLPAAFTAGQVLTAAEQNALRGAFRVLQVVSTTKLDTYTHSSGITFTNVTGLAATITPSATSSKVLIYVSINSSANNNGTGVRVTGGNAADWIGAADGSRTRVAFVMPLNFGTGAAMMIGSNFYLDSPASTSAITYQVQINALDNATTTQINRTVTDTNSAAFPRATSTITVMEISA